MRALVLSGGAGSRLRPITHTQAKQLIPIAGTPILFRALASIAEAGIHEVGVVVGPGATGEEVRSAVGDGSRWGLEVTYVEQPEPLGIAHAVTTAAGFVRGEPFLLYLGDNVLVEGVARFVRGFERTRPAAQILLTRVPEPEHFGVAVLEGEHVVRLVEKPSSFVSDVALVGVYLFDDSILEACASLEPSWRGEYEITEAIQWLIDHGRPVRAEMVTGWWKDTGRPEDLLEANRVLLATQTARVEGDVDEASTLEGAVVVAAGAKVTASRLVGPVVIGARTIVDGCTIGPDVSVEPDCELVRSAIDDAIVMEGCRVVDVDRLSSSILGRNVDVRHSGEARVHRLVVGDQSRVEVD
ncbi:MAG TPA: glucose-1-phosphate thymidylyltransferase [Actinomycetota bacterium]